MDKFFTWDFSLLLVLILALFFVHELGHYLAYRLLGYRAVIRKAFFVPGIDPKETIEVTRYEGVVIAMSGFVLSAAVVVLPCALLQFNQSLTIFVASIAGSFVDFIWAMALLNQRTIRITPRN